MGIVPCWSRPSSSPRTPGSAWGRRTGGSGARPVDGGGRVLAVPRRRHARRFISMNSNSSGAHGWVWVRHRRGATGRWNPPRVWMRSNGPSTSSGGAPLGDNRLTKRLLDHARRQGEDPLRACTAVARDDWSAVKGYYRLMNEKAASVTLHDRATGQPQGCGPKTAQALGSETAPALSDHRQLPRYQRLAPHCARPGAGSGTNDRVRGAGAFRCGLRRTPCLVGRCPENFGSCALPPATAIRPGTLTRAPRQPGPGGPSRIGLWAIRLRTTRGDPGKPRVASGPNGRSHPSTHGSVHWQSEIHNKE